MKIMTTLDSIILLFPRIEMNKPYFVISEMVKQSPTSQPERNMGRSARSSVTKSPKMNGHTGGNYSSFLLKLANPKVK